MASVGETTGVGRNATTTEPPKAKPSTTDRSTTTTTTTTTITTTTTPPRPTTPTTTSTTKRTTTSTTKRTTTSTTTPTTTTSSTTTTTTPPPTTVLPSTTRHTPTPNVIHVDPGDEAKPGYVAVSTLSPPANTSGAGTAGKGMSASTIGVIAGTVGGIVVIVVVLVILLIILLRRRKRKRQRVPKIENPQYRTAQPQSYRFSRDSALYVGNTVNLHTNNNAAIGTKTNEASPDGSLSKQKRKAPPPPNPFGGDGDYLKVNNHAFTDIYEKDSHASSENIQLGTFSARNYQASSDAVADEEDDDDHRTAQSAPLIDKHAGATGSVHSESDSGAGNDEENESSSGSESARSSSESEEADEEASQTSDKVPLSMSVDSAGRSLDEYDKTRNPFVVS